MNRRQVLISGGSAVALVLAPAIAIADTMATFVPPTTSIVHLAARIGHKYFFDEDELVELFGLNPPEITVGDDSARLGADHYDDGYGLIWNRMEVVSSIAERGARDVYHRARLIIGIKEKLIAHFGFSLCDHLSWINAPKTLLQGETFRALMMKDLRHAANILDFALQGYDGLV
jgi:hypothetical protein